MSTKKKFKKSTQGVAAIVGFAIASTALAQENTASTTSAAESAEVCAGFAGQTPRDIDSKEGTNPVVFELAPPASEMNLCNIHFHEGAEHKAEAFSIYAGDGEDGFGTGYQCGISKNLSDAELSAPSDEICKGLKPGDTIEVHWVHSSCDIEPGPTLGACLSDACANPDLRVETQVFTLVNDADALDFSDLSYAGNTVNGFHQAKALPEDMGLPVEFMGSTTGPSYDEKACSPLQVTWSVRPQCAKLDINSIGKWCESNVFDEDHAHGVRKLVTDQRLLAPIE
ncbi:delta-class carbonic anhydrase [Arenicella sp.]|nr:delta-class carbonic anhydrase [Arenicella sp.]